MFPTYSQLQAERHKAGLRPPSQGLRQCCHLAVLWQSCMHMMAVVKCISPPFLSHDFCAMSLSMCAQKASGSKEGPVQG